MEASNTAAPNIIYSAGDIAQGIEHLARGLALRHPEPNGLGLVGVHGGGGLLVRRVEEAMARILGREKLGLAKGLVDISFYRDDWSRLTQVPILRDTIIPWDVEARPIVLIDDVIFTGRTTRSALEAIFSLGRPAQVELAVLVDRGHRELPLQPDLVGLTLQTQRSESVNVFLHEDPNQDHARLDTDKYKE